MEAAAVSRKGSIEGLEEAVEILREMAASGQHASGESPTVRFLSPRDKSRGYLSLLRYLMLDSDH
jgi:hypothetical protein